MNLPLHVLFVMNNASAYPPGLKHDLFEDFIFFKIQLLSSNATSFNLKKFYTDAHFKRCFEVTEGTNLTLRKFQKYHSHIVTCLNLIEKTWEWVTKRSLTSAWNNFCFETVPVEPVVNIVFLGKTMELEVDNKDIVEFVQEHRQELTTKSLWCCIVFHRKKLHERVCQRRRRMR